MTKPFSTHALLARALTLVGRRAAGHGRSEDLSDIGQVSVAEASGAS